MTLSIHLTISYNILFNFDIIKYLVNFVLQTAFKNSMFYTAENDFFLFEYSCLPRCDHPSNKILIRQNRIFPPNKIIYYCQKNLL